MSTSDSFFINGLKKIKRYFSSLRPVATTKNYYNFFYNRNLNLSDPTYLSEKLQYLKLYVYPDDRKVILAADKYGLHQYLKSLGLENYSVPYITTFDKSSQIDFDLLPKSFVLKKTNASGYNLIVKNKDNITKQEVLKITKRWFKNDFGKISAEKHYSNSTSRIICEPYLEIGDEYRLFMIGGKLAFIQIIQWEWDKGEDGSELKDQSVINGHSKHLRIHLDPKWNLIWKDEDIDCNIKPKPVFWDELVRTSSLIAKDFPIVRVDFNEINGQPKITELTFTPASGYLDVLKQNPDLDLKLGGLLKF